MQKLFTASQIRNWDNYTIVHEPISSLNLMERASSVFVDWFVQQYNTSQHIYIYSGPGNNGGDGLAICRLLLNKGYQVTSYLINPTNKLSPDCATTLDRLTDVIQYTHITDIKQPEINKNDIIIDALFGSGLSRPLSGIYLAIIQKLNTHDCIKIAIDVPSGMYCDSINSSDDTIFKSNTIASFQIPKRSFYFIENKQYFNSVTLLGIGLSSVYNINTDCSWYSITSTTEIPDFNNSPIEYFTPETFSQHFKIKFNSIEAINMILKTAVQQQKFIGLKYDYNCIATPKKNIYFILG